MHGSRVLAPVLVGIGAAACVGGFVAHRLWKQLPSARIALAVAGDAEPWSVDAGAGR